MVIVIVLESVRDSVQTSSPHLSAVTQTVLKTNRQPGVYHSPLPVAKGPLLRRLFNGQGDLYTPLEKALGLAAPTGLHSLLLRPGVDEALVQRQGVLGGAALTCSSGRRP